MTTNGTATSHPALPPGIALYQMAIGHYASRALALAAKLGVADLLRDGPRDAPALARATDTNASALQRVLRLLVSVGVFTENERGAFALTPVGELLREDAPGSMRAMVSVFAGVGIQDSWKELEYCVRSGQPAFRRTAPDADPFTAMAEDPAAAATFDKAMAAFTAQTAVAVARAYDFSPLQTIADIGGGNGALILGILQAHPHLRGIVFDQPQVAARARDQIAAAGLADRCEATGGSFFEAVPTGADAYLVKHVIHDWNDERAAAILRTCRAAMKATAKLLIIESLYPDRIDHSLLSRGAAANDVNMLVCTGGRQRSEAEFRQLLTTSGFGLMNIIFTPAMACIIEGAPA